MIRIGFLAWVAWVMSAGCAPDATDGGEQAGSALEATQVVARVGGRAIGAAQVEARMRTDGVDAQAALDSLIGEELLLREAARLGFVESRADERIVERLMVRSMLRDFEEELTPESISPEEVEADFAEHGDKLQVPERRDSWHILAKETGDAGRELAEAILRELDRAGDPRAVYDRYAGDDAPDTAIDVKTEDLPAITEKANIEDSYKDALFAAKSEGPLKDVVKTSYGWHAIVLTEITPGERKTVDDLEAQIRERLSQKKRFERLVGTVGRLEARGLVEYDEQGVERLMSMAGLPERAGD